jgi:hypothetical protein
LPAAIPTRIAASPRPNDAPISPSDPGVPLQTQLQKQRERLLASFSEAEIEKIEHQHQDLVTAYQEEQTLKACLDNRTLCSTLDNALHLRGEMFALLRDFAGGLAIAFPSTATVKSAFFFESSGRRASLEAPLPTLLLTAFCTAKQSEAVLTYRGGW